MASSAIPGSKAMIFLGKVIGSALNVTVELAIAFLLQFS
jgi:hypothetical protein